MEHRTADEGSTPPEDASSDPAQSHAVEQFSGSSQKIDENENETWVDVTETFTRCAQELGIGELVHGEKFSLDCAMNAMEIMDPKMDPNCEDKRVRREIRPFQQLLEAGQIKVKDFSSSELIGIMDELLACVATWMEGQCLAQTVFTCLYTHNVTAIEDRVLKVCLTAVYSKWLVLMAYLGFLCGNCQNMLLPKGCHI